MCLTNPSEVKKRAEALNAMARQMSLIYAKRFRNKEVTVMLESSRDKKTNLLTGYTDTYLKVLIDGPDSLCNNLVRAKITDISETGILVSVRFSGGLGKKKNQ